MVRGARQLVLGELYLTAPKPETEAALREPARRGRPPKRRKPEPDNHRAPEQGCKQTPVSVHWAEPVVASVESVCFWDRSPVSFGSSVCDRCARPSEAARLEYFQVRLKDATLAGQKHSAYLCAPCAAYLCVACHKKRWALDARHSRHSRLAS